MIVIDLHATHPEAGVAAEMLAEPEQPAVAGEVVVVEPELGEAGQGGQHGRQPRQLV